MNQSGSADEPPEADIRRSLMQGLDDGFGVLPELDAVLQIPAEPAEPADPAPAAPTAPRKRRARAAGGANKRLVVDAEVCLSVACIRTIRDGYVGAECRRRRAVLGGLEEARRGAAVEGLAGAGVRMRAAFVAVGPGGGPAGPGGAGEEAGAFEALEIEVGRRGGRSRSSSVSSVEEARRAERHSSSFHFDFDGAGAAAAAAAAAYDNDMDVAQLDISFPGTAAGPDDTDEAPCLASVEQFWDEAAGAGGGAPVAFGTLAPPARCGRREACARFMYVLQLATWGRLDVSQRGARGDILVAVK